MMSVLWAAVRDFGRNVPSSRRLTRLLVVPADDILRIRRVNEQSFLLRHRMHSHNRVDRFGDRPPQHSHVAIISDLPHKRIRRRMRRPQPLQPLPERRRKPLERSTHVRDHGIAPGAGGTLQHAEERQTRRLRFGGLVDVELDRRFAGPGFADAEVGGGVVDYDELDGSVLRVRHPAMLVQGAEVGGDALLLIKANIGILLIAEDDAAALGGEEGELVEPFVGKIGELDTLELCSAVGAEVECFSGVLKEMGEGWVCAVAWVVVFEGADGFDFL